MALKIAVPATAVVCGIAVLTGVRHVEGTDGAALTYNGTFELVTEATEITLFETGGGTISITLTSDRSGVSRIKTEGFLVGYADADTCPRRCNFGQDTYFAPSLPVVNDSVSAEPPIILDRVNYSTLQLEIHLDSETQLSGTGQIVGGVTSLVAPFTATGPVQPPPAHAVHTAGVEGQEGSISIALDRSYRLQSYTLQNVSLAPCVTTPQTLSVLFDSPRPIEEISNAWLSLSHHGVHRMWFTGQRDDDSLSGTFRIFPGGCSLELRWTTNLTTPLAPTATQASTFAPAPFLPSTGSRHSPAEMPTTTLLATTGALALAAGVLFRRLLS